jgi:hypothetical protein
VGYCDALLVQLLAAAPPPSRHSPRTINTNYIMSFPPRVVESGFYLPISQGLLSI